MIVVGILMGISFTPSFARIANGSVDYSQSMQALFDMTCEVLIAFSYVIGLVYAIASLLVIYNAMVIYIKLNTGEQGFTKAVITMFGAIFFLIGATIVLPSFFGYSTILDHHPF